MKAGDADLDAGEDQANLGMPPTSNAPLDIRAVANSGLAIIAPLHLLPLGPLSIGALAIYSSDSIRWWLLFGQGECPDEPGFGSSGCERAR